VKKAIVAVENLRIRFPTQDRRETVKAVDGVSFAVMPGETFGIIGESGSGKSTLGRAVVCLLKPTEGRVLHGGTDPYTLSSRALRLRRRAFQIIFQDPNAALNPRMNMLDSIREPLDIVGEGTRAERDRIAMEMLERVGLRPEFGGRYPHEISGGQKQRINIARVLTVRPSLIVCDEVVAALDVSIRADILNLFADLQREFGLTYLFITHDLGVVSHVSSRIAVMYLGKFMEMGPAEDIAERPLHPYTQALDREVRHWHQPLVDSAGVGLIALLCQRRRGVLHVLLHACAEAGLANIVEFGASVQVAPGAVPDGAAAPLAAFAAGGDAAIRVRCRQSEEGGRFHRDENDYVVAELAETTVIPPRADHIWVGIAQLEALCNRPGLTTNEMRSVAALLLSLAI